MDWRQTPTLLTPLRNVRERLKALDESASNMAMAYPCGFVEFGRILVAQHYEWKALIQLIVPPEQIDVNGYAHSGYVSKEPGLYRDFSKKSRLDELVFWNCSSSNSIDLLKQHSGE